jgi:hypothetical protein
MKTSMKSVLVRHSGALTVAALALSFAFGNSGIVRAEDPETDPTTLREMVFVPVMRAVQGLEQRLTSIEATINSYAESFTSQRIATRQLCVADDSGAETCITKAQLDALLTRQIQVHAEAAQPSITVSDATPEPQADAGEIDTTAALETNAGEIATTAATVELAASGTSDEFAQDDQEPTQTGSIPSAIQGSALVWFPEVEISTPVTAASGDE